MYVCLCNALRERDLRDAIERGAHTGEQALAALGCVPGCGSCLDYADFLVTETLAKSLAVSRTQ